MAAGAVLPLTNAALAQPTAAGPASLPSDQIGDVAISAWLYAYPLILMEMTRRTSTNVAGSR